MKANCTTPVASATVFTSTKPKVLGKVFKLVNNELTKEVAGNMCEGTYMQHSFTDAAGLISLLESIGIDQALSASVPSNGSLTGPLTTKSIAAIGALARTKENFKLPSGPGLMILDYDPHGPTLTQDQLYTQLVSLVPTLKTAICVWWCSGSSYIYSSDGLRQGLKGQRFYIPVLDASDLPRFGELLSDLCWLNGLGYIKLSSSGSCLKRGLFDAAMFEDARLDFIGGAVCEAPLYQDRPAPVNLGGEIWFDSRDVASLSLEDKAKAEALKVQALDKAKPMADAKRLEWEAKEIVKVEARLTASGVPEQEAHIRAEHTVRASSRGTLLGDFELRLEDGNTVTVQQVLDNRAAWDKVKTLDPTEPAHRGGEACGIMYLLSGSPVLFTFAHGGQTFKLIRQLVQIEYSIHSEPQVCRDIAKAVMRYGDIYKTAAEYVILENRTFHALDAATLKFTATDRVVLVTQGKEAVKPMRITSELTQSIAVALRQAPEDLQQELTSITSLPYAVPGRLVLERGYDRETKIFNSMNCQIKVNKRPNREDCVEALRVLWKPWSEYLWANDESRSAMLAGIFTAVLRPALDIAPGFFYDAPTQGSGKTKAAVALGSLMAGEPAGVTGYIKNDNQEAEYVKSLIAMLRGPRRFMLIDNVVGTFSSSILSGLISSGYMQGRLLGVSEEGNYPARILSCATGNNATLSEDLGRRYLICRIDTKVERPIDIKHGFEPADVAMETRYDIAKSVLTLLQAYWNDKPVQVVGGSDYRLFAQMVREPIEWINQQDLAVEAGIGRVVDPHLALGVEGAAPDPSATGLLLLLTFLAETFPKKGEVFTAGQLYNCWVSGGLNVDARLQLLRDALENLMPNRTPTSVGIGRLLQFRKDKVMDGLKLESAGVNSAKTPIWRIVRVTA